MRILGIDPGLENTGFGAIEYVNGLSSPALLRCGHIRTLPKLDIPNRLFQIYSDIDHLIEEIRPDMMAIENAYSLVRYPRAGIILGCVLGAIYVSVFHNDIRMVEITPREVKKSLAGYGGATKAQIRDTVKRLLKNDKISSFHAADALAAALTAFYREGKTNDDQLFRRETERYR
jgi:crossover junction endodeoxyribonuclease RuvC